MTMIPERWKKQDLDGKVKFMFSKKATKIDEIFTIDLTLATYRQIDGEDFINLLENMNFTLFCDIMVIC